VPDLVDWLVLDLLDCFVRNLMLDFVD